MMTLRDVVEEHSLNDKLFQHPALYTPTHPPHAYTRLIPQSATATYTRTAAKPQASFPWMNSQSFQNPGIRIATPTPPLDFDLSAYDFSASTDGQTNSALWQMYGGCNDHLGGGNSAPQQPSLKRQRTHQRTPSASTIASNGPQSPYDHTNSYPYVASTDTSPNAPTYYDSSRDFGKTYQPNSWNTVETVFSAPGSGYVPSAVAHTPSAHLAIKDFAIDHHTVEDAPEFAHSNRHSMSSHGLSAPSTPRSNGEEADNKSFKVPQGADAKAGSESWGSFRRTNSNETGQQLPPNSNPSLFRTESAAFQDELYNPANFTSAPPATSKPQVPTSSFLTPHRNLVNERLQTANIARSASPSSAVSRERSPFRQGSPYLAQATDGWTSPRPGVGTAAGMRQQQKEETEQAEYAHHQPTLRREPTKTISPKDALLDYNETDSQAPLFQDNVPNGYQQHFGGTEKFPSTLVSQPSNASNASNGLPFNPQQMGNFRATSADGLSGPANFNFATQGLQNPQTSSAPFQADTYRSANASSNNNGMLNPYSATSVAEPTPDFPAHLTSMDSSMSDQGPPVSSQESNGFNASAPRRPSDTRAATGTYTCTYHGCTQRFDSPGNLQRHKREVHRTQHQQQRDGTASATSSSSPPRSIGDTESPGPAGAGGGMTSAALLARNSQAGPHKCTRINPSTNKPCNTIFSRPYDLTRHEDTIHNNRKQKVRCPMCREEKTFSRNDALTRHMRVVHPEVEAFGKRAPR